MNPTSYAAKRQDPLRARYAEAPEEAHLVDHARTEDSTDLDPFHGRVVPGSRDYGITWPIGIHHIVGGDHDLPNPGDLLCAALSACLDSTLRIIADRMGVTLRALCVDVSAELDARGTLMVDRSVPVGFQRMRCHVAIDAAPDTPPKRLQQLLSAAETCCVTLQTLKNGVPIESSLESGAER